VNRRWLGEIAFRAWAADSEVLVLSRGSDWAGRINWGIASV